jgi:hypothetical protein
MPVNKLYQNLLTLIDSGNVCLLPQLIEIRSSDHIYYVWLSFL